MVSTGFVVSLTIAVALIVGARFALPALPFRRVSTTITVTDAMISGLGLAGLLLHCLAMFFPGVVEPLPGTDSVMVDIRALGTASIIWYGVPAGLVLIGLRRQHIAAPSVVALSLAIVGLTMYNGSPLQVHLSTIFVAVLVLAGVAATLVIPPWQRSSATP